MMIVFSIMHNPVSNSSQERQADENNNISSVMVAEIF